MTYQQTLKNIFNYLQKSYLTKTLLYLCLLFFCFAHGGCSFIDDGIDQTEHVLIVDTTGNQLTDVVVIPLYYKSYGIGAGPDGKGFKSSRYVITKPFLFHSGNDLMKNSLRSKYIVTMFPPHFFVGSGSHVVSWLFIKKGYSPQLPKEEMVIPIVMTKSNGNENSKIADILLASKPNQEALKKLFTVDLGNENINIELNKKDIAVLKESVEIGRVE
jgi:hypothetical protein